MIRRCIAGILITLALTSSTAAQYAVLRPADYAHYVENFNNMEPETAINLIPNDQAWQWMTGNVPLLDCPAKQLEETYYFRWWTYRKHIKQTPDGRVLTEFLNKVNWGGAHNTIACALGHHIAEGRWLRDSKLLDEYVRFWFRSGENGGPAKHFHNFSGWVAAALYDRYLVTGDRAFVTDLLDDLVADYNLWVTERGTPDGMFWQYDVRDGMEESISGGRRAKNTRPTITSYMAANARAISNIAMLAGRSETSNEFAAKADALRGKLIESLWDDSAKFFKVRFEQGGLSDAREAIGFIPWMFNLPGPEHAEAWRQLKDRGGFWAPCGITTAERRHPKFRSHGTGTCEWDGAVWPYATSQTLVGLANLLRGPAQAVVTRRDYFEALLAYSRSHQMNGKPYIGEYLDEQDGHWLITGPKANRSRYYNHSTFNDLVICGLVGIVPHADDTVEVNPLLPDDAWEWFCLDGVPYHGHMLSVIWDRTGNRYSHGKGLALWIDGKEVARSETLAQFTTKLPSAVAN